MKAEVQLFFFSTALVALFSCNEACPPLWRLLDSLEILTAGDVLPLPGSEFAGAEGGDNRFGSPGRNEQKMTRQGPTATPALH